MNVPKLRFKEFCEDVTHKNSFKSFLIKDIANIQVGRDLREESFSEKQASEHLYPVYSNTVENRGLYGFYNFEEYDGNSLTIVGRGVGLGTAFARNSGFGAIGRLLVVSPKNNEFDVRYFAEYINYKLKIYNESGGIPQLPGSAFGMYSITLPHIAEQAKIANFLTAVDEKISLLTQKSDLLAQYKKGVMQKIFSQELRFKDDDGREFPEWEERTLGDICRIRTGKKDVNEGNPNGAYPFFTCAKKHTYSDNYSFDCSAILIAGNGEVGHCQKFHGKFEAYQRTYVLTNFKEEIDYIFCHLNSTFQDVVSSQKQMGAMPYLKLAMLTDFSIPVPVKKEQIKIANFLSAIDDKITQTQAELDAVKQYKQGLLQQMFL